MYLGLGTLFTMMEVRHKYKLVFQLKELYQVNKNNGSSIFSDGDLQALIPDTIFYEKSL